MEDCLDIWLNSTSTIHDNFNISEQFNEESINYELENGSYTIFFGFMKIFPIDYGLYFRYNENGNNI